MWLLSLRDIFKGIQLHINRILFYIFVVPRENDDVPLEDIVDSVDGGNLGVVRNALLLLLLPRPVLRVLLVHPVHGV